MVADLNERRGDADSWAALSETARRVLLSVYVEAAREGLVTADDAAALSAIELGELYDRPHESVTAAHLAEDALAWTADEGLVDRGRSLYANRLLEAGRSSTACDVLEDQLCFRQAKLGSDDPDTLTTRNNLAVALRGMGHVSEAIELCQAVIADRQRVLGSDDPLTLTSRNNLACYLGEAGRVEDAVEQFDMLVAAQQRVLEPDDLQILLTHDNLAGALLNCGRPVGRPPNMRSYWPTGSGNSDRTTPRP